MQDKQPQPGALNRLLSSILALAQTRLELAGIELAEEKARLFSLLFLSFIALLFGTIALTTLTALIVTVLWDTHRWQTLAALASVYSVAALFCLCAIRAKLRKAAAPFEATLAEFRKDHEAFGKTP
ncbi:phage holin family protein [Mycoavidus sp. SF9855]|uniref:phage holin family protein n=1 Tax=Mycoavidus sp. SF9855 TaxID=2968475 RepID=UPI00211B8EB5|nr:phage holin family protein [Mycoavidus sp. SF9855]UUM21247.1 phage holin family protein [Mycoavidus sp. SF9855]